MGNKIGKVSLLKRSKKEDRQPLLQSDSEEDSPKEKREFRVVIVEGNKYERLFSLEHSEPDECEPIDSGDDDYSIADYLAELSDLDESSVENQRAEASGPPEYIESEDLAQLSNAMKDLLQSVLNAMSNSAENIPLENLKKLLSEEDIYLLDLLMKVSKELKNISVPNLAWKNLIELLVNAGHTSGNPEASIAYENITTESLFSMSVYGIDCYLASGASNWDRIENPMFYNYVLPLLQEKGLSCLNITRYDSERKRTLDITLICKELTCKRTKLFLYLWDSKDDKWRLIGTPYIEMDSNKCFSPPDDSVSDSVSDKVRAEGIPNPIADICKCRDLPQSTPSADLPLHIKHSLESEIRLTAFNSYLDKKIDVTLAQGKKHEHKTDFYIEWTGNKKAAYSFTVPNDAEPAGQ